MYRTKMSHDGIKKYYLLCTVRLGKKAHVIDDIRSNIDFVFTKREINLFLREVDGHLIARELVVGGRGGPSRGQAHDRQPIVVFGP
jgi:hypothetical protein